MKKLFKNYYAFLLFAIFFASCQNIVTPIEETPVSAKSNSSKARLSTEPIVVANSAQLQAAVGGAMDCPLNTYVDDSGTRIWYHSTDFGENHQRFLGTLDAPCGQRTWVKTRTQLFTNNSSIDGKPWIVGLYKHQDGLLAFIHIEFGGANGQKGRIALAWSTDNGNSFKLLGNIISSYGEPDSNNGFMEGSPYLVKDGYFYTYYRDNNEPRLLSVARAPLNDVINAAKNGTTSEWKKYYNGGWNETGLGGNYSTLAADGICHTAAVHSSYNDKYYLTTTWMTWNNANSYIKLWESTDAVNWTLKETIIEKTPAEIGANTGYQYASIAGEDGSYNSEVGQKFYLFCGLKPYASDNSLLRWTNDCGAGSTSSSLPTFGGSYVITGKKSDKPLSVDNSSTANGGYMLQWDFVNSNAQRWIAEDAGNGYYKFKNVNSNKYLSIDGCSTTNGARVNQWDFVNANCQLWQVIDDGNGWFKIINKNSGTALSVDSSSMNNGANILLWDWVSADAQRWKFESK